MFSKLTDRDSIDEVIKAMSLEEKARLVIGDSPFRTKGMEQYGIPALVVMDGGTGFNSIQDEQEKAFRAYCKRRSIAGDPVSEDEFISGMECLDTNKLSALAGGKVKAPDLGEMLAARPLTALGCYPPGMFLGATWNPEVIKRCGRALGREANSLGIDILLGTPNVNIHRDPLGGRIFEGYSEDPCLVSSLAPAFVKGILEGGVVANVKHFAQRGVVYITLCHNGDNDVCDSAKGCNTNDGVSKFGEKVIREMNRNGIMVDLSHANERSFFDALEISKMPIVCSHSSCRALCDVPRNLTDEQLRALAQKGGVAHITLYPGFLRTDV